MGEKMTDSSDHNRYVPNSERYLLRRHTIEKPQKKSKKTRGLGRRILGEQYVQPGAMWKTEEKTWSNDCEGNLLT